MKGPENSNFLFFNARQLFVVTIVNSYFLIEFSTFKFNMFRADASNEKTTND